MQAVIAAGARTVVVAGMIPIGCEPEMLALFPGGAGNYYDPASGCITRFNALAELHNRELQRALHELRRAHPGATAVRYADLYGPVAAAVASPKEYGTLPVLYYKSFDFIEKMIIFITVLLNLTLFIS